MAVDTRSKRASSVGILIPSTLAPVLPDGTIAQADRQHVAFSYSGIAAAVPAVTIDFFRVAIIGWADNVPIVGNAANVGINADGSNVAVAVHAEDL